MMMLRCTLRQLHQRRAESRGPHYRRPCMRLALIRAVTSFLNRRYASSKVDHASFDGKTVEGGSQVHTNPLWGSSRVHQAFGMTRIVPLQARLLGSPGMKECSNRTQSEMHMGTGAMTSSAHRKLSQKCKSTIPCA